MGRKPLFVLLAATMLAVIPQTIQAGWMKTYGGELDDHGCAVEQTSDGGYIIAGQTYSFGEGNADAWLLKTDAQGDTLWSRTYGGTGFDHAAFVRQTSDGGYIITGLQTTAEEDMDVWLLKTDSLGKILWEQCYGGDDHDEGWCVQETSDGGYIIAGDRDYPKAGCGNFNTWLLKTDSMGDTVWTRTLGKEAPTLTAVAFYVQETSEGDYIFVGTYDMDLLLLKTNSEGDSLWAVTYDCFGFDDRSYCIQETSDGGYIITGLAYKGKETTAGEIWLLKTDSQGDTIWTRTFGGDRLDWGLFVSVTSDGGYIIAGLKNWYPPAWSELWLIKTDSEGNEVWSRTYGNEGVENDWAHCVRKTSDGGYIITGSTESWGSGGFDLWLIKTNSLGLVVTVDEEPVVDAPADWQVLSPIGQRIVLRYKDRPDGFHASVFDATGRKVDELHATESSGMITWGKCYGCYGCYGPGVYFIVPTSEGSPQALKVVLIQ